MTGSTTSRSTGRARKPAPTARTLASVPSMPHLAASVPKSSRTDESWLAMLFHPGIETWVFVFGIWLTWRCLKYAFKRLVLDYLPPEKIKEE